MIALLFKKTFLFGVCGILSLTSMAYAKSTTEEIGDYMQYIVPAYALGMSIYERDWEGSKQFIYLTAASRASVYGLKSIVDERRPNGGDLNSFPSGHTASAFSGATFIHKRYGYKRAIVPYLMAGFTGYSRIDAGKHYVHDVVAGAAISGLFTWIFVDKYDRLQLTASPEHINIGFNIPF